MADSPNSKTLSQSVEVQITRANWLSLLVPILLFTLLRLPALLHQPGGQDEQFFSVPGWTVLHEGIPRIPYYPARNRATFFENADRCLMAIPPALFYVQAVFFAIFPAGYPTSRLPSFFGALAIISLIYCFARQLGARHLLALMAATLLACSRPLMFTGIIARPDLLCILCGLAAMYCLIRSNDWNRRRLPLSVGGLCGLAGLFHPLALVFGIQSAVAMLLAPGSMFARVRRLSLLALATISVLSLWLLLIVKFPHEFASQFFSNVVDRAGPGLHMRLLWPIPSFGHHGERLWEFAGPWQFSLLAVALTVSSWLFVRHSASIEFRRILALSWSSVYLTATVAGIHPISGYWLYATVLILVLFATLLQSLNLRGFQVCAIWLLATMLTLPGAGLRSSWIYLRHFGDPAFHGQKFIRQVLAELPQEGLFLVDLSYVFDVYLTGRETKYCAERELLWGDAEIPYEYLLIAWEGSDFHTAEQYGAELVRTIGMRSQPQSCYVNLFKKPMTQ